MKRGYERNKEGISVGCSSEPRHMAFISQHAVFSFCTLFGEFFFSYGMINFEEVLLFCCAEVLLYPTAVCLKVRHLSFKYLKVFISEGRINFAPTINRAYFLTCYLHCFSTDEICELDKGTNTFQNFKLKAICMKQLAL